MGDNNIDNDIHLVLDEVIFDTIQEIEVKKKIKRRNINQRKICNYEREIINLKEENRKLEKQISNECKHDWVRESPRGMYERRWKICTKCNLYNMYY